MGGDPWGRDRRLYSYTTASTSTSSLEPTCPQHLTPTPRALDTSSAPPPRIPSLPLNPDPHAPLALAERILDLLDQGRFTATYKYAVLLALLDLCLENAARDGAAPDLLTTRQLAVKIVELYWPHTRPWATRALRQSSGPGGGQAEIVADIEKFRAAAASDGSTPLAEALARAPARYRASSTSSSGSSSRCPCPACRPSATSPSRSSTRSTGRSPSGSRTSGATSAARAAPSTTASTCAPAWGRRSSG